MMKTETEKSYVFHVKNIQKHILSLDMTYGAFISRALKHDNSNINSSLYNIHEDTSAPNLATERMWSANGPLCVCDGS